MKLNEIILNLFIFRKRARVDDDGDDRQKELLDKISFLEQEYKNLQEELEMERSKSMNTHYSIHTYLFH